MDNELYGVGIVPMLTHAEATKIAEQLSYASNTYDAWYAHSGRLVRYADLPSGARILRIGYGPSDRIILAIQELGTKI